MGKVNLSVVIITKNSAQLLEKTLRSVKDLADEIVIVDDHSTDSTKMIATQFGTVIFTKREYDLGRQRAYVINKARGRWILMLDSDESIDKKLAREIQAAIKQNKYDGFIIPFQNHFLGRGLYYGGENYQMLRLFRKTKFKMEKAFVHEKVVINSKKITVLKNKIQHYSYQSIWQMYKKFTDYAIREAKQRRLNGESTSLKKIVMYPPHMFWARFIKDKGYRDGLFRIPLDLGFAYMEFLTYMTMLFLPKQNIK